VRAIGFAEKGALITTIGGDGMAVCFAVAGGEKKAAARVSPGPVSSALISADGSTALVLGERLTIWDGVKLALRRNVNLLLNEPTALALSADGANVLVSHAVGTFIEGPENGIMAAARVTNSREAGPIALSADNRVLYQGTERGELLVWQAQPPRLSPLARIRRAGNAVAVTVSPDGKWLAAGGDDSQITIWKFETGEKVESLPAGGGTVYALQFSPDSRLLASATLGGTTKVWGVKEWNLEGSLLNPNRLARCVAFSPDGRWLATGGSDRKLVVTDTQTWETAVEKADQDRWVEGVAFSPDGRMLYSVTGSWDPADQPIPAMLTAWKIQRGKDGDALELEPVKTVKAHANTSDNVVVTPDSRVVITGSGDGGIKVWDAATLAPVRTIRARRPVHHLHLLRSDPDLVVAGEHFGDVSVWNSRTGKNVANCGGHVGHVFDVAATNDGRLLISAGEDDQLLFWPGPTRGPDEKLLRFLQRAGDEN
jgi:WD40 repeat protein